MICILSTIHIMPPPQDFSTTFFRLFRSWKVESRKMSETYQKLSDICRKLSDYVGKMLEFIGKMSEIVGYFWKKWQKLYYIFKQNLRRKTQQLGPNKVILSMIFIEWLWSSQTFTTVFFQHFRRRQKCRILRKLSEIVGKCRNNRKLGG